MKALFFLFLVLAVVSVFDLLPDPYHHKSKVNVWAWLDREIIELLSGERDV